MKQLLFYIIIFFGPCTYSQNHVDVWVGAKMDGVKSLDNSEVVETWGFGIYGEGIWGITLPAPVLTFTEGDSVHIHFINKSPESHTIHLHGLDVSQEEDGVPSTSFLVMPNDTVVYDFKAGNAGTYLYHCHVLTTLHLTMGMYGMIVVESANAQNEMYTGGPTFTRSYNFLASDMDISINQNPLSPGPFYNFKSDYYMQNGWSGNQLYNSNNDHVQAYVGDTVLLRLGSMAYSKTRYIFPPEFEARAYMSDGRILPQPFDCDTLDVYSGERYAVLLIPTENVDTDIIVESFEMRNNNLDHTNLINVNGDIGLNEIETQQVSTYPNPTDGIFNFVTSEPGSELILIDGTGRIITSWIINDHINLIDISNYPNGVYFLNYRDKSYKLIRT